MRLSGQGEAGPGGNGDALVTIEIAPHRFFKRDGDDVRLDLPVRLDEVVLGAKVKVPTVEGAVMLTVPAGSTSGRTLRLRSEEHTSELQSLLRISYAVFCLKKKNNTTHKV